MYNTRANKHNARFYLRSRPVTDAELKHKLINELANYCDNEPDIKDMLVR